MGRLSVVPHNTLCMKVTWDGHSRTPTRRWYHTESQQFAAKELLNYMVYGIVTYNGLFFPAVNKSKNDAEAKAKQKENAISRQAGITYKTVALQDEWQRSQEAAERCTFQQTGCPHATCWLSSPAQYHGRSSTQSPRIESGREDGGEPGREADSEISPGNGRECLALKY